MNTLPNYTKALLLQGASTTGTFTEGYFFVEERLQSKHATRLFEFCKWIDAYIGGASSYNIDWLFQSFSNPGNIELTNRANELSNQIKKLVNRKNVNN
jgi:hypothetical protein